LYKKPTLVLIIVFVPLLLGILTSFLRLLALVNRIVTLHGGQIDVRSRQEGPHGTVFTVKLPERVF
jgi:nitrogen-specific signal transduction histidine kinase